MPQITILPHPQLCPEGATFEARSGSMLCEALLRHGVRVEHACDMSCACSTCHVIIRKGFETLDAADDGENDQLDRAWGVQPYSRLACQVVLRRQDLTVELPRYSINLIAESN
jgi:2Fe-2S ferredoxin